MSFMFGIGYGKRSDEWYAKADEVAKRHNAWLCGGHPFPGEHRGKGWKHWFACFNHGSPFDQATARAVMDDLQKEGLL